MDFEKRKLERKAAQGDPDVESKFLREQLRAGELSQGDINLAAYLGDPSAKILIGEEAESALYEYKYDRPVLFKWFFTGVELLDDDDLQEQYSVRLAVVAADAAFFSLQEADPGYKVCKEAVDFLKEINERLSTIESNEVMENFRGIAGISQGIRELGQGYDTRSRVTAYSIQKALLSVISYATDGKNLKDNRFQSGRLDSPRGYAFDAFSSSFQAVLLDGNNDNNEDVKKYLDFIDEEIQKEIVPWVLAPLGSLPDVNDQ